MAAIRTHPTSFRLLAARAMLLAETGRYRDATETMRRAMQAVPERLVQGAMGRALGHRMSEHREAAEAAPEERAQ